VIVPVADPQPPPDYYGYEENPYQASAGRRRPSTAVLAVIIAAIAIVCLCCGLVLGLFIPQVWYWLGPTTPTVTPTPAGMLFFALYG
jgi:hypothetical protein